MPLLPVQEEYPEVNEGGWLQTDQQKDVFKLRVASYLTDKTVLCFLQTFLTLSLQDMASRVQLSGPQEAEKYVLHMVSSVRHNLEINNLFFFLSSGHKDPNTHYSNCFSKHIFFLIMASLNSAKPPFFF